MTDSVPARKRKFHAAVATAAIPAVMLSAVALAEPAQAGGLPPRSALMPKTLSPTTALPAAGLIPASQVAAALPRVLRAAAAPASHVVSAGETVSHIAARYGLSMAGLLTLNNLTARTIIHPGQSLKLTAPAAAAPAPTTPAGGYTVKAGDTLYGIAARQKTTVGALLQANGLSLHSIIRPGQKLNLAGTSAAAAPAAPAAAAPAPTAGGYTVKAGDTLGGIAARHGISLASVLSANGLKLNSIIYPGRKLSLGGPAATVTVQSSTPAAAVTPSGSYTVASGDTLYGIAAKHSVKAADLASANSLSLSSMIRPGQKLSIPGGTGQVPSQTTAKKAAALVPSTFLHYTYPSHVVAAANVNKATLLASPQPTKAQMQAIIADTARSMGVDTSLALAHAYQESGFNMTAVSPANAIGAMQVIPSSGEWASDLVGRKLNLLDPYDNATAGVAIIRSLVKSSSSLENAIASYYQGQTSVKRNGMFSDTKTYVAAIQSHQKKFS